MEPSNPASPEGGFRRVIAAAVQSVRQGRMPTELLLDLVRERPGETVEYCIKNLADPALNPNDEAMIAQLIHLAGLGNRLVQSLILLERTPAEVVALRLAKIVKGLDLKISEHLQSEDSDIVMKALDLLGAVGGSPQLMPHLFSAMQTKAPKIQSKLAFLIQKMDTEHIYTQRLLQHPDPRIRANSLQAIAERNDAKGEDFLRAGISDPDTRVRTLAAVGLARRGNSTGMWVLLKMLRDPNPMERRSAAWGLGACGHSKSRPLLESLSQTDSDTRVRELAVEGLQKLANDEDKG